MEDALTGSTEDSFTVTLKEQEDDAQTLVAVHVTVVVPVAKVEPEAGTQTTGGAGVPVEEGSDQVTTWLSHCTMEEGHEPITGEILMVTLKEQFEEPLIFEALQFTGVVPAGNVDPEAGEQTTFGEGLPDKVGDQVATALSH